jgi:putative heme iron utilization protein
MAEAEKVIRDTDAEAIRMAKTLIRTARFGALAVLDPESGAPMVSRVGVATDFDGTPLILVSMLAAHTRAILADPRCSLMLGEPGKGDALAYPRISLACEAAKVDANESFGAQVRRRYLNRNPKASLYAGLGDFHFFRLGVRDASLNGGFGRAYQLTAEDVYSAVSAGFDEAEQAAIDHMNADHADAIQLYASHFANLDKLDWRITGFDADGIDLASGDRVGRVFFPSPLTETGKLRAALVEMARTARTDQT